MPENLAFEDAAAAQTTFSTAWHALKTRANLQVGETVLVNAAGSGVGIAAVQVARLLGGRVLVSAGSDEKIRRAVESGADAGVNYKSHDLAERVLELTDGRGVDVVMESVGGDVLAKSLQAIGQNGRVVTVGAHAGEVVPVDVITLFRRQASLLGSVRATVAEIRHVLSLVGDGVFKTEIYERFSLEAAAEAHIVLAERANYGKVILVPEVES
jgi:NADPH:quinone reductase-like Zn-dependent oxidoreductase